MERTKNKKLVIGLLIMAVLILVIGGTYAFIELTLTGEKKQTIVAGTLSLELLEDDNNISITDALPMYDEVGMIQEPFTFRLVNNGTASANYVLKLVEIGTGTLAKSDVKYGLTKEGLKTIGLLSDLNDGVIDSGTIAGSQTTINYTLRLWIRDGVTDQTAISGKSVSYRVDVEVSQVLTPMDVLLANGVETQTTNMFNYTNEGCTYDAEADEDVCPEEIGTTNGIYMMEDDDGPSYFYRGKVDNLVQFGAYETDYYVYRYNDNDFTSLEACQYYDSNCAESNKALKYSAGTPMYWRIIRVNGDGTIRMIYSGTTKDAVQYETGIGLSRYNEEYDDPKYTGYTYDRTTTEVKSDAKTEIDTWYDTYLANSSYDQYIAEGKFCSDSSGYQEITEVWGDTWNVFSPYTRNLVECYNPGGDVTPTFKCAATSETYGGSYNLKAGLITLDEVIAAGGGTAYNTTYYLYNGTEGNYDGYWYWTMSPAGFNLEDALVGLVDDNGNADNSYVYLDYGLLRPVINLKAGTGFYEGTDGSVDNPYIVIMD